MTSQKDVRVRITHLEMLSKPHGLNLTPPSENIRIERIKEPSVPFYREMYEAVGGKWHWQERKKLQENLVKEIIQHPDVHIFVLRTEGRIIGFAELDFRQKPDLELKYFGFIPEYMGKGFGGYFLNWTIQKAWELKPGRFRLHTCSLDHPKAFKFYQKAGFIPFETEEKIQRVTSDV